MSKKLVQKRSVTIDGHRTSVTLEAPFWDALKEIADTKKKSVNALIAELDKHQPDNLSGAVRVFILEYYRRG